MAKRMVRVATLAVALVGLAACSQSPTPAADVGTAAPASTAPVKTPFDTLLKDRDKAKNVQKTVLDAAARQRQAIKDASG